MSYHTIAGRRYRLVYGRVPGDLDGQCDPPDKRAKQITVRPSLRKHPRRLMEVLLHEALHAAAWQLDETAVERIAEDLARLLWSQGFRLGDRVTG